jgi:hypothetical protein
MPWRFACRDRTPAVAERSSSWAAYEAAAGCEPVFIALRATKHDETQAERGQFCPQPAFSHLRGSVKRKMRLG